MRNVYLDYSATTPVKEEVLKEMIPYFTEKFGVSAIVGAGLGDAKKKDPDFIWNLGISVSYRIWNR